MSFFIFLILLFINTSYGRELLIDGNFELDPLNNWKKGALDTFVIETSTVAQGTQSAKTVDTGTSGFIYNSQLITDVVPGGSYTLSGYIFVEGLGADAAEIQVCFYDTTSPAWNSTGVKYSTGTSVIGSWVYLSITVTAPADVKTVRVRGYNNPLTSGSTIYFDALSLTTPDDDPPQAITNLSALTGTNPGEVDLTWTAPDEDSSNPAGNPVAEYFIRYSTKSIADLGGDTTAWWNQATEIDYEPTPASPGTTQSVTITGLLTGVRYYFAIKSRDESNYSPIDTNASSGSQANAIAKGTPDTTAPDPVTEFYATTPDTYTLNQIQLQWIATGDDGTTGDIVGGYYWIRYSTNSTDTWDSITLEIQSSTDMTRGSLNTYLIQKIKTYGLNGGTSYYFYIKLGDEVPNWSLATKTTGFVLGVKEPPNQVLQNTSFEIGDPPTNWTGVSMEILPDSTYEWKKVTDTDFAGASDINGDYAGDVYIRDVSANTGLIGYSAEQTSTVFGTVTNDHSPVLRYFERRRYISGKDYCDYMASIVEVEFDNKYKIRYSHAYKGTGSTYNTANVKYIDLSDYGDDVWSPQIVRNINSDFQTLFSWSTYTITAIRVGVLVYKNTGGADVRMGVDFDCVFLELTSAGGDTTPPSAISNLTALTHSSIEGAITLKWTAPGDDGTSGNITGGLYRIKSAT
ncbi:MAG: hypothetical protein DRI36_06190, partial [Caldiserica bacterium]